MQEEHPFYGSKISRVQQEEFIEKVLSEFKGETADDDLRKKVYDALMLEKHRGNVNIPFKVLLKVDETGNYPPHLEVVLDTRV